MLASLVVLVAILAWGRENAGSPMATALILLQASAPVVLFAHLRRDREWLTQLDFDARGLLCLESFIAAVPGAVWVSTTGTNGAPVLSALVLAVGGVAGLLPPARPNTTSAHARTWLHFFRSAPAVTAGLRGAPAYLVVWIAVVAIAFVKPWAGSVALIGIGMALGSFSSIAEPRVWVQARRVSPTRFLLTQIGTMGLFLAVVAGSVALVTLAAFLREPLLLSVLALGWLSGLVVASVAVLTKYRLYDEGRRLDVPVAIAMLVTLISFLFPIMTVVTLVVLWRGAHRRMCQEFHAGTA